MTTTYISWFNKVRRGMSVVGIVVNGILHKAQPIRQCPKCDEVFGNGSCPKCSGTAGWRQTNCTKCGSISAFVFQSTTDKFCYFIFCQRCGKFEFVRSLPAKPVRYVKKTDPTPNDNINGAVDPNEPPLIGSPIPPAPSTVKAETKAAEKPKKASKPKADKAVGF